jgi:hypothetical protein
MIIDGMKIQTIKGRIDMCVPLLKNIINSSLKNAEIPDLLKSAIIRPVYKGGDHKVVKNYRPISNPACVDKLLEKHVSDHVKEHMKNNKLWFNAQFAYQKGIGAQDAVIHLTQHVNSHLSENK